MLYFIVRYMHVRLSYVNQSTYFGLLTYNVLMKPAF